MSDPIERIREAIAAGPSKVPISYDDLRDLATLARRVGTLDAFADVALQWADLANQENERLREDAERYRWLRGDSCPDHSSRWTQWEVRCWKAPSWTGDLRRADLDDAIDAARGKE